MEDEVAVHQVDGEFWSGRFDAFFGFGYGVEEREVLHHVFVFFAGRRHVFEADFAFTRIVAGEVGGENPQRVVGVGAQFVQLQRVGGGQRAAARRAGGVAPSFQRRFGAVEKDFDGFDARALGRGAFGRAVGRFDRQVVDGEVQRVEGGFVFFFGFFAAFLFGGFGELAFEHEPGPGAVDLQRRFLGVGVLVENVFGAEGDAAFAFEEAGGAEAEVEVVGGGTGAAEVAGAAQFLGTRSRFGGDFRRLDAEARVRDGNGDRQRRFLLDPARGDPARRRDGRVLGVGEVEGGAV